MGQSQQAFLLQDKTRTNEDARRAGQEETYVKISHIFRWLRHCVRVVTLTTVVTEWRTSVHALKREVKIIGKTTTF